MVCAMRHLGFKICTVSVHSCVLTSLNVKKQSYSWEIFEF